ncbi:MAG: hypothetical protein VKJ64_11395 [Leptolyngbyaceae bacterium]|nr:hypothetical protein [Leptolyngbyaceae bacterium]
MAIIALKAWYINAYEPIEDLEKRSHDLRLSRNSLLKSALRADFLDDSQLVRQSEWFLRYLAGEVVEFYIEGSGGYAVANVDLISHEIYFTKRDLLAGLEPHLFFCYQDEYPESSELIRESLDSALETLNRRSRIPLTLEASHRLSEGPVRLNSTLIRKIRQSLLFIADGTPILQTTGAAATLIPSPTVCVETGYALHCKRPEQILILQQERSDLNGMFPFDVPSHSRLLFQHQTDLNKHLVNTLKQRLDQFNLFKD